MGYTLFGVIAGALLALLVVRVGKHSRRVDPEVLYQLLSLDEWKSVMVLSIELEKLQGFRSDTSEIRNVLEEMMESGWRVEEQTRDSDATDRSYGYFSTVSEFRLVSHEDRRLKAA